MTRTLSNGSVELELGTGDLDRALGELRDHARSVPHGRRRPSGGVRRGAGRLARRDDAHRRPGPLDPRATGPRGSSCASRPTATILEVQAGYRPTRDDRVRARRPGRRRARRRRSTASWSTATTRGRTPACARGPAGTDSYWSSTFTTDGRRARDPGADRPTSSSPASRASAPVISVASERAPTQHKLDDSWGHENRPSTRPRRGRGRRADRVGAGGDRRGPGSARRHRTARRAHRRAAPGTVRRRSDGSPGTTTPPASAGAGCSRTPSCCASGSAPGPGFDLVQIDDGWQENNGAWWPRERFPDDFGELVETIHGLGQRCGLWLAPVHGRGRRAGPRHRTRGLVRRRRRRPARRSATGTAAGRSTRRTPPSSTTSATSARRCAAGVSTW